jgi:hypothetical protein
MEYNLGKIPNTYNVKRNCFEKQLDSIQILILGDSHANFGIDPTYFSIKGFNLSSISQTIYYDVHLTLKYIDKMPKLNYVIINISYFSLGAQLIGGEEDWRDFFYSNYWNIVYSERKIFDIRCYSKIFMYTPKTSISYLFTGFNEKQIEKYKSNGFMSKDTDVNTQRISDSLGYLRVKGHDDYYKEKRVKENRLELEQLLYALKKRNITPIFITTPTYITYFRYIDTVKHHRDINIIKGLCNKFHCKSYDYFTDSRFIKTDFWDNDHLNFIGAKKFTVILNDTLKIAKE